MAGTGDARTSVAATLPAVRRNPVLDDMGSYGIAAIQDRARRLRESGGPLVDFSIGDPREPTPSFIPEALRRAVPVVSQYPTIMGLPALRQAIAGYVDRRFGVALDPDTQILPTTGSKESIFSTPLAFVDRQAGDGVAWATPGYPIYERGARLAGAVTFPVRLADDFVFRASAIANEVWSRLRIVWLNSPHNPAGVVTSVDELTRFRHLARDHDVLLCSDECYIDLYDGDPPPSLLETDGGTDGVLIFLSLSKRSGMTGYRSGAVVGDARAIAALKSLRSGTGTAPPEFTQAAATAAWNDDAHVDQRRRVFRRKRRVVSQTFEDLGYPTIGSEAGLYLWQQVGDDVQITERLLEGGVVVSPGRMFGPGGEGHIRLALVPSLDECRESAKVIRECLG